MNQSVTQMSSTNTKKTNKQFTLIYTATRIWKMCELLIPHIAPFQVLNYGKSVRIFERFDGTFRLGRSPVFFSSIEPIPPSLQRYNPSRCRIIQHLEWSTEQFRPISLYCDTPPQMLLPFNHSMNIISHNNENIQQMTELRFVRFNSVAYLPTKI